VAASGFLNAGGRAFGWYCPFVAITAVAAEDLHLQGHRREHRRHLAGIDWVRPDSPVVPAFMLLTVDRPIARLTGYLAIAEGIATSPPPDRRPRRGRRRKHPGVLATPAVNPCGPGVSHGSVAAR
jgi:hypothetical protein